MDSILIVDDDHHLRQGFERLLAEEGYDVRAASSGEQALALVRERLPDCVIMDVRMPGMDGLDALQAMRSVEERLPVIIMTAFSTTETAIEAIKLGAFDYILKPFDIPDVLSLLRKAVEAGRRMRAPVSISPDPEGAGGASPAGDPAVEALIGRSAPMHALYKAIGRVAPTDALVLLRGESGTGKELAARAIYQHSPRARKPFNVINCVAIPDTLLESELFGYERGAFTGAASRRIGKIEQASGGTLFLDEIGDMPLGIQAKLLRLLQERQIERLGGREPVRVDVRIIAATNADLEAAVAEGRFREDLYYRLKVVSLHLPPLRDRREDIPLLADWFLERHARALDMRNPGLEKSALEYLMARPWPGNVRELANALQKALVFSRGMPLTTEDVKQGMPSSPSESGGQSGNVAAGYARGEIPAALTSYIRDVLAEPSSDAPFEFLMDAMGRAVVREALRMTGGNRSHAARLLGLSRPTLLARMEKYGLKIETRIA